jgi:hypothetical protein
MTQKGGCRDEDDEGGALLQQVMRGERPLLFPPGTLVASIFVPCFVAGAGAMAMQGALALSGGVNAIIGTFAATFLMTGPVITGHVLVIRGRPRHRLWIRTYVRCLVGWTLVSSAVSAVTGAPTHGLLILVSLASLGVCDLILGSRAYLAFSSFFSLKRRYRCEQVGLGGSA